MSREDSPSAADRPSVRLFVEHPLGEDQTVALSRDQANYLFNVLRLRVGAEIAVFNGRDGEWRARVVEAGKRGGTLVCEGQTAPQTAPPDLWLLFAPLKKTRTDFVVEKAVELGAARICPVHTARTNAERLRRDRLQAHAIEAAEQCGATTVPEVMELQKLADLLAAWPTGRTLVFADEGRAGTDALSMPDARSAAILIGPEGGFTEVERTQLLSHPSVVPLALGPRILRAETAALAALTLWQAACGDWR